jgi:hypothetical protein
MERDGTTAAARDRHGPDNPHFLRPSGFPDIPHVGKGGMRAGSTLVGHIFCKALISFSSERSCMSEYWGAWAQIVQ